MTEKHVTLASPSKTPVKTGPEVIAAYPKTLPQSPGVYRMLDTAGEVIYVGKARSLRERVSNYARLNGHTNRITRMILATASMEFVTVRTEAEALLLEANLIKRFRPRFNVLMRDDKSFPYIQICRDHGAPAIMKYRGTRNRKGEFFGPFASAGAVNRTVNMLQRAFLLRSCSDSIYDGRTRPCLLYQIKRCSAPCANKITLDDYGKLVDEAERFLSGKSQTVREMYQRLMEEAAKKLEFETAAKYRDRLWVLTHVTTDQSINPDGIEEADIFAAYQDGGQTCIQVFFFRTGQNWGNRAYYPKTDFLLNVEDVLDSFIAQFYDDKPVPRLILISHDIPNRKLLAEALITKAEHKVEIRIPLRGMKSTLVEHALANACEALGRKLAENASQAHLLEGIAERFGLSAVPRRIEVFDNSHISGTNAVGGMIVSGPEGFIKRQYHKFNIKSPELTPGDDCAMMREVLTRRFKHTTEAKVLEEIETEAEEITSDVSGSSLSPVVSNQVSALEEHALPDRPDLVLIDGGRGQLSVAREVLASLGMHDIALIGVAKGPNREAGYEHFYIPGREQPIMLEARDPVFYFIQRLRDEAHRFAIRTHRAKRAKLLSINPLDEIDGVGPTRKRALLRHFGSAKAISRADTEDLKVVDGISTDMAKKIYDFFHERAG